MPRDPESDLELLRRFEPVVRFNEGEYFLPASVDAFVRLAELWERTGPSDKQLLAASGTLDLDRLVALTDGQVARHYLRLVAHRPSRADYFGWQRRRDRPRFRPETRLGRVGVLTRLVDAAARVSLLARGRTPRGAEAAAAMLDRDRDDHGEHPYYGRVVRSAGYVVLQYWFFSFFNDWRSRAYGVNDHEGDWEQVTVYLVDERDRRCRRRPGSRSPRTTSRALTSGDVGTTPTSRSSTGTRWSTPGSDHTPARCSRASTSSPCAPTVSVASPRSCAGSRASSSRGCTTRATNDPGSEFPTSSTTEVTASRSGTAHHTAGARCSSDDETPWIRSYTGLWGDDTNDPFGGERGPAGPRYERDGTVRSVVVRPGRLVGTGRGRPDGRRTPSGHRLPARRPRHGTARARSTARAASAAGCVPTRSPASRTPPPSSGCSATSPPAPPPTPTSNADSPRCATVTWLPSIPMHISATVPYRCRRNRANDGACYGSGPRSARHCSSHSSP